MNPREKARYQKVLRERRLLQQENLVYQRLAEATREGMPLEDFYKLLITTVTEGFGFDRAGIFLLRPDGKTVELAMGIDTDGSFQKGHSYPIVDYPNRDPFSDIIGGHKEYFLTNNIPRRTKGKTRYKFDLVNPKFLNHAIVPIEVARYGVLGILAVDNLFQPRFISKADIAALRNFATQAGLAIQSFRQHEQIVNLTLTDQLTGVHNRRYFDECLASELERCKRYSHSCVLLYVDLDHFKRINDRYGHLEGDRVLKQVAGLLLGGIRHIDRLCRIGGEEFAVLLPETGPDHAVTVTGRLVERVREAVPAVEVMARQGERITISIGAAFCAGGNATPDQLMQMADQSLYRAKDEGRNRVGPFLTA